MNIARGDATAGSHRQRSVLDSNVVQVIKKKWPQEVWMCVQVQRESLFFIFSWFQPESDWEHKQASNRQLDLLFTPFTEDWNLLTVVYDVEAMTCEPLVKTHKRRRINEWGSILDLLACTTSTANITHRISSIQNADRKTARGQQRVNLHEHPGTKPLRITVNYQLWSGHNWTATVPLVLIFPFWMFTQINTNASFFFFGRKKKHIKDSKGVRPWNALISS